MTLQRSRRGVGKVGALCLVLSLVVTLILPTAASAAQPDARDMEIVKKAAFNDGQHEGGLPRRSGGQQFATITGKLGALSVGKKGYAIAIGSNYQGSVAADGQIPLIPPFDVELEYAEADAQAMAGLLAAYGFDTVIPLIGDAASRHNILNAIKQIGRLAKPGDEVVFFYSGHGARQYARGWKEKDREHKGVGVIHQGIVSDQGDGKKMDFLWDEELAKEFSSFRTDRIVFVFDMCLAGGMTELARKGRIVAGATTSTGIAVEVGQFGDMVIDHGLFTFFLLAALSGLVPEADAYDHLPGVPDVTVEEAYNFASFSLIDMTPLIQGELAYYYGEEIAALWGTPVIVDLFCADMLLQALPSPLKERTKEPPPFHGKG
ncbi:MAG: caspase family protein [Chloroflexi bacterium]|nr:caspase family protein [Chloroflexota bacterium]